MADEKHVALLTLSGLAAIVTLYSFWKANQNADANASVNQANQGPYPNVQPGSNLAGISGGPVLPSDPFTYDGPSAPNSNFLFNGPSATTTFDSVNNYAAPGGSNQYLNYNAPNTGLNTRLASLPQGSIATPGGCGCGGCGGHAEPSGCSASGQPSGSCPGSTQMFASSSRQLESTLAQDPDYIKNQFIQVRSQSVPNFNVFTPSGDLDFGYSA